MKPGFAINVMIGISVRHSHYYTKIPAPGVKDTLYNKPGAPNKPCWAEGALGHCLGTTCLACSLAVGEGSGNCKYSPRLCTFCALAIAILRL